MADKQVPDFCPANRQEWRNWLQENQDKKPSVWLIYYKKNSTVSSINYNEAVEEALCFGWIDGQAKPLDEERYQQFFTKRKPNGGWSKINKERIDRLIESGLMTRSGYDTIEKAKQNGSWALLDEVEALVIPADLELAFKQKPKAINYFTGLCRSDKRNILQWLVFARRPETRQNRINEIVDLAELELKPKQFRTQKKEK